MIKYLWSLSHVSDLDNWVDFITIYYRENTLFRRQIEEKRNSILDTIA